MVLQEDAIIDISKEREKFFGCSGKMLLPCPATIAAQLSKIPENKLMTTELLSKVLSAQFEVEVTCPSTTQKALRVISRDSARSVPYWRLIKKNGDLMAIFPGGAEAQAALLSNEGFAIDSNRKVPRVGNFQDNLVHLR